MRAVGISMRRILRPVLLFATLAWTANAGPHRLGCSGHTASLRTRLTTLALKNPSIELRPRVFYERPNLPWMLYFDDSSTGDGIQSRDSCSSTRRIRITPTSRSLSPEASARQTPIARCSSRCATAASTLSAVREPSHGTASVASCRTATSISAFRYDLCQRAAATRYANGPRQETPTRDLWERLRAGTASIAKSWSFISGSRFRSPVLPSRWLVCRSESSRIVVADRPGWF